MVPTSEALNLQCSFCVRWKGGGVSMKGRGQYICIIYTCGRLLNESCCNHYVIRGGGGGGGGGGGPQVS